MTTTKRANVALWVVQVLLAAVFLFARGFKLVGPAEAITGGMGLPVAFLRFIGACEVLGALGLLLPGALRVWRTLTPIAAVGLACIMTGATVIGIEMGQPAASAMPFAIGLLASLIAIGRAGWAPARLRLQRGNAAS